MRARGQIAVWSARLPDAERIVALTNGARWLASAGGADPMRLTPAGPACAALLQGLASCWGVAIAAAVVIAAIGGLRHMTLRWKPRRHP